MGAKIKRDMMANWIIRSSEYWLKPLYDEKHKHLITSSIIMNDETTWKVNHEEGKRLQVNPLSEYIGLETTKVLQ